MTDFSARRRKLRQLIKKQKADALLVTSFVNVTYLDRLQRRRQLPAGDARRRETLVSDSRYTIQLDEECPGLHVSIRGPGELMMAAVLKAIKAAGIARLAVEGSAMTVDHFQKLDEGAKGVALQSASGLVEELRTIKDKSEIEATRRRRRAGAAGFRGDPRGACSRR